MDILNFISWIRGKRQVTTVDPAKTVIPLGVKDGRRDDDYLAVAMTVEDFANQLIPPPVNIYNSDGTLTDNRIINGGFTKNLRLLDLDFFSVQKTDRYTMNLFDASFQLQVNANNLASLMEIKLGKYDFNNNKAVVIGKNQGTGNFINSRIDVTDLVAGYSLERIDNAAYKYYGLKLDFTNKLYQFGQIEGGNTTTLTIDDAAAYPVQISGTNVSANTAGVASGQFLKIKVNGVDYKIALLNT